MIFQKIQKQNLINDNESPFAQVFNPAPVVLQSLAPTPITNKVFGITKIFQTAMLGKVGGKLRRMCGTVCFDVFHVIAAGEH